MLQSHSKAPTARADAVVWPFTPLKFTVRSHQTTYLVCLWSKNQPVPALGSKQTAARTSGKSLAAFVLGFHSQYPAQQAVRISKRLFVNLTAKQARSSQPKLSSSHAWCLRSVTRVTVPLFNQRLNPPITERSTCIVPSSVASGFL